MKKIISNICLMASILTITSCVDTFDTSSSSSTSIGNTSTSNTTSSNNDENIIEVNFSGINDFHGTVEENGDSVGLAKMGSYLKQRKQEDKSILISSGDQWQGQYIDGSTHGDLVSSAFKEIGFDAVTLGNHEFDWGDENIFRNQGEEYFDNEFLAANLYDYPQVGGEWVKSDLGKEYEISIINEGTEDEVKVGIIGVLGEDVWSSINSHRVRDYIFLDPLPIVKEQSKILKEEMGCDIIAVSIHEGYISSTVTDYADVVFLGHEHQVMNEVIKGVPFMQSGGYSQVVSNVTLNFNKDSKEVSFESSDTVYLSQLDLEPDAVIENMINEVKEITDPQANEYMGTLDYYMDSSDVSRFHAQISAEYALENGYDIDYCSFNSARTGLYYGEVKYSDLYATHPFENQMWIVSVKGEDIYSQSHRWDSPTYRIDKQPLDDDKYYNVLVYDYNGFHMSSYTREYDRYPSIGTNEVAPIQLENITANILARDWFLENENMKKEDYSSQNDCFNKNLLRSTLD